MPDNIPTVQSATPPCSQCNGELAKAMLEACTPEQIAHAYVHAVSREQHLRNKIERALKRLPNGRPHPNDISWARELLRAALEDREARP